MLIPREGVAWINRSRQVALPSESRKHTAMAAWFQGVPRCALARLGLRLGLGLGLGLVLRLGSGLGLGLGLGLVLRLGLGLGFILYDKG